MIKKISFCHAAKENVDQIARKSVQTGLTCPAKKCVNFSFSQLSAVLSNII